MPANANLIAAFPKPIAVRCRNQRELDQVAPSACPLITRLQLIDGDEHALLIQLRCNARFYGDGGLYQASSILQVFQQFLKFGFSSTG